MRKLGIVLSLLLPLVGCDAAAPEGDDAPAAQPERGPLGKADAIGSCQASDGGDYCGGPSLEGNCWCDDLCDSYGDCCSDEPAVCDPPPEPEPELCLHDDQCESGYCDHSVCLSNCPEGMFCPAVCWGQCGEPEPPAPSCEGACGGQGDGCWCDALCQEYGDCCGDYEEACLEPDCDALVAAFQAETAEIRACEVDADCGQVLTGTSCGCTRNWVARADADIDLWDTLRDDALDAGCSLPGMISTCDCPPANGFVCNDGICGWSYQ